MAMRTIANEPGNKSLPRFAAEVLAKKYRCSIEVNETPAGDYVEFRTRGMRMDRMLRVDRTALATMLPSEFVAYVERGLQLGGKVLPREGYEKKSTPSSPIDSWADKWMKENGGGTS